MIDWLDPYYNIIRVVAIGSFGFFFVVMGAWVTARGAHEQRQTWRQRNGGPLVAGRIVFGLFLLNLAWWCGDISYQRLVHDTSRDVTAALTDFGSTLPLVLGAFFGAWSTLRVVRNNITPRDPAYPVHGDDRP